MPKRPKPRRFTAADRAHARRRQREIAAAEGDLEALAIERLQELDEAARRDPIYDSLYPRRPRRDPPPRPRKAA